MKTDTYTKVVLTIIAIALSANVIKGMITPAKADNKKFAAIPVNPDGSITVKIAKGETMDVNIASTNYKVLSSAGPLEVIVDK